MKKQVQGALLAAAVATLFAAKGAIAAEEAASEGQGKEVKCSGINACKGQGSCAGEGHSCGGQNACKGKGVTSTTEADCKAKGGKIVEGGH